MHRLEATPLDDDFDNQMATFRLFVVNLDLNMDHPKA
jgi:hypothetical protein